MRLRLLQLLVGAALVLSMGGLCPLPDDAVYGRPCDGDAECGDGYACAAGKCAPEGVDGDPLADAGARDDAGHETHADGGHTTLDGGESDAGERPDGGVTDGGQPVDAGGGDGGPVDAGCSSPAECDDGLFCTGVESCVDGACVHSGDPCAALGDNCLEASDTCASCTSPEECDDGNPCNGEETCVDGSCGAGTAVCGASEICLTDPLRCVECTNDDHCASGVCVNEQCVACRDSSHCDDGVFCNGAETCDTGTNTCVGGAAPCGGDEPVCVEASDACVQCVGDGDCGAGAPFCVDNVCVQCTSAAHCSDGLFCNGAETCNLSTNTCQPGIAPCGGGTPGCLEASDTCVPCTSNGHCGGATPYCAANNSCVACTSNDHCPDDGAPCNGEEVCNTATGLCRSTGDPCAGDLLAPYCIDWGGSFWSCGECRYDNDCPLYPNQFCAADNRCCDQGGGGGHPFPVLCPL